MHDRIIRGAYINPESRLSFLMSSRDVQITTGFESSANNLTTVASSVHECRRFDCSIVTGYTFRRNHRRRPRWYNLLLEPRCGARIWLCSRRCDWPFARSNSSGTTARAPLGWVSDDHRDWKKSLRGWRCAFSAGPSPERNDHLGPIYYYTADERVWRNDRPGRDMSRCDEAL